MAVTGFWLPCQQLELLQLGDMGNIITGLFAIVRRGAKGLT